MPPAAALVGSTIIGGATSLIGGGMEADAARQAAKAQSDAARRAADIQQQQYGQTRQDLMPWMQQGQESLGYLGRLMAPGGQLTQRFGVDPYQMYQQVSRPSELPGFGAAYEDLTREFEFDPAQDPSYQWRLQQGQKALEASAAARGGYFSGETGKSLTELGQGMASQEYQRAFERDQAAKQLGTQQYLGMTGAERAQRQLEGNQYGQMFGLDLSQKQNLYNMLSGLSGAGQQAAAQTGQFGQQAAGNLGQYALGQGAAEAGGITGSAGAWADAIRGLGNTLQSTIGQGQQYNMMAPYMQNMQFMSQPGYTQGFAGPGF